MNSWQSLVQYNWRFLELCPFLGAFTTFGFQRVHTLGNNLMEYFMMEKQTKHSSSVKKTLPKEPIARQTLHSGLVKIIQCLAKAGYITRNHWPRKNYKSVQYACWWAHNTECGLAYISNKVAFCGEEMIWYWATQGREGFREGICKIMRSCKCSRYVSVKDL